MTGWGQEDPLVESTGHDINYIALSGALSAIGELDGKPAVPLNLLGDFGGGAMYLAFGTLAALYKAWGRVAKTRCSVQPSVTAPLIRLPCFTVSCTLIAGTINAATICWTAQRITTIPIYQSADG